MIRLLMTFLFLAGASFTAEPVQAQDVTPDGTVDSTSGSAVERDQPKRPPLRMAPGEKRSGRGIRRMDNPTEADIDSFILVATELKPEWKDSLESMRAQNPDKFQETLRSFGRRIWYLVELRAQNPNLYRLRIEEIHNDEKLWALATQHREAMALEDSDGARVIMGRLQELALIQVDLKLRVRAEELAAMSNALERLRKEVMQDLERRQAKADELVERLISGKMPPGVHGRKNEVRKLIEAQSDMEPSDEQGPAKKP